LKKIIKIFLLSLILLIPCKVYSQILSFRLLTVDDGLPQNSIETIIQDKKGYVWVGCEGGVSRYDGVNFKNFTKEDGLSDNHIRKIFEDSKGVMWFATNNGITSYNGKKFQKYFSEKENAISRIYDITEDNKGNLWFVTGSNGLIKYDRKSFTYFSKENGLPTDSLRSCFADKQGNLWVGTMGAGIVRHNDGKFSVINKKNGITGDSVLTIYQDKTGNVWFGTNNGVSGYDGSRFFSINKKFTTSGLKINTIIEDNAGVLWFGTSTEGIYSFDKDKIEHYTKKNGLSSDIILCIIQDTRGDLWFGTRDGGICKLPIEKFKIYNKLSGLPQENVFAIYKDKNNTLWFGHNGYGITQVSANGIKSLNINNGLPSNDVPCIIGDKSGNIWVATFKGVVKFSDSKKEHFTEKNGLTNDIVISLFQDSRQNIWFGCAGGPAFYDLNYNKIFSSDEFRTVFGKVWINNIYEDATGNIWFATDEKGVLKYDGRRFTQFNTENGFPSNIVSYITQDRSNNFWFASEDGLIKFDGSKYTVITTNDGLPSNNCYFAIEYGNFIYIGTNQGLVKFDYKNFDRLKKDAFKHYTIKDGLASSEMNIGAIYKDRDNNLYFGTQKGVTYFNLNDQPFFTPSPIYLNNMRIIEEDKTTNLEPAGELDLAYTQNNIRFDFIAVGFTPRDKYVYKHRLIGLEADWIESNEPYAQYPYLPPGKYTFEVICRNADGVWSVKPASFTFEINPPIWLTWWAITFFIILGVSSMYGFYLMKTEQVKKRNIELANMVKERTKDLELEKDKSDELLLNILPFTLVQELKTHGAVMPREFKNASILFTDFKSFTFTASILPADKLVNELNEIFLGFDKISDFYGLEKLKTIGDSYMAAGGLPNETDDHALRVVLAALKMQEFIIERNKREALKWEMRAGIHCGQVIAGVVGTKKFTYDIWGDTVNIASRMESSGEPGRVNISAFTYMLVKDYFICEYRGKVDAKGKGKMDMYFVTGIKDNLRNLFDIEQKFV